MSLILTPSIHPKIEEIRRNLQHLRKSLSLNDFRKTVFRQGYEKVEGAFHDGWHLDHICQRLQDRKKTVTIGFRGSSKSSTIRCKLLHAAWTMEQTKGNFEALYFSYTQTMAQGHMEKAKRYIEAVQHSEWPWWDGFRSITDNKTEMGYEFNGKLFTCKSGGLLSFSRGEHANLIILDDPLRDPQSMLDKGVLDKIARSVREEIFPMLKPDGELHIVGTLQDQEDILMQLRANDEYDWKMYPAEYPSNRNPAVSVAMWPELFPMNELKRIRKGMIDLKTGAMLGGEVAYQKEFLLRPVRQMESFISDELLLPCIGQIVD